MKMSVIRGCTYYIPLKIGCRDMALPLKQMRKRLQPCNAQMAMRPTNQRNQASPQQGYKHPKYNQSKLKHKSQQADWRTFCAE
jgi:hypothetical protein